MESIEVMQWILISILKDEKVSDNDILKLEFDSTPSRVERGIRHAIESEWSKGSTEKQEQLFCYSYSSNHSKPTSSMFIASIVDDMKINL